MPLPFPTYQPYDKFLRNFVTKALVPLLLCLPQLVSAQSDSKNPSIFDLQGKEAATELPSAALPSAQQRAFGGRQMLGKTVPGGNGYSLIDKGAPAQPVIRFSTQVETKVENKTTNHISGSGGGGSDRPHEPAPEPKAPPGNSASLWTSDFELYVAQIFGKPVPSFGERFLASADSFKPNDAIVIPNNYVISIGDEVTTRAWGEIDIDQVSTVGKDGTIFLPKVGVINVLGIKYQELQEAVRKGIEKSFRNFQLSVTLNTTRTISVNAVGVARRPGTYQINPFSKFIDAVFAVGGPAVRANHRMVSLRRDEKIIAQIDLYEFFLRGAVRTNPAIQHNDVIVFDSRVQQAAVVGQLITPGIFQITDTTTAAELLDLAGGVSAMSNQERLLIERVDASTQKRYVTWVNVGSNLTSFKILPGDIISVLPISPKILDIVTLQGQIAMPLRQPWKKGMRITDLIPSSDFLVNPNQWIRSYEKSAPERLTNAKANPDTRLNGPSIHWEYATIERLDPSTMRTTVIGFHLGKAINMSNSPDNHLLEPGDVITILSQEDLRVPSSQKVKHIKIDGEIAAAGIYPITEKDTLESIIKKAGGVTSDAYLYGIELNRESVREQQQARFSEAIDRLEQDLHRAYANRLRNSLSSDVSGGSAYEVDSLKSLVAKLRGLRPTGRIALSNLTTVQAIDQLPKLTLEEHDTIFIPKVPAVVHVVGAVVQHGSFLYDKNKSVRDYLQSAGGFSRFGDRSSMYIIRMDGTILDVGQIVFPIFNIGVQTANPLLMPGDTIVVPENVDITSLAKTLKDWTQVLYQFGLGAAGLKILRSQ